MVEGNDQQELCVHSHNITVHSKNDSAAKRLSANLNVGSDLRSTRDGTLVAIRATVEWKNTGEKSVHESRIAQVTS